MTKGVDVSVFQDGLKLKDAVTAGYGDFVIVRGGYTGYGAARSKNVDRCFEGFYQQAKELKIPVGCYYYSCANTRQGGIDEAEFLYEKCLAGKKFELPVYIDVEDATWQLGYKAGVTEAIIGFCETIEAKGFTAGVYASWSWFNNYIDTAKLYKYTKWVAAYWNNKPSFDYSHFDIWQNSSSAIVGGMRVDTDIAYKDFGGSVPAADDNKEVTCMVEMKQLAKGSTGAQVKTAQAFLANKWGYSVGAAGIDGIFGDKTLDAVRRFQKAKGLTVDGIVGVNTWNALLH